MNLLSAAYGWAARGRRNWYRARPHARRALERPVISVGNIAVGGRGKTPLVAALARLLLSHGERPAILSRGYGRRTAPDGVVVVSDGEQVLEPVERAGDEPNMLARLLPGARVMVSADRYLAGRLAERQFNATVHLLDDGFQHVQLERDIDLLLVSPPDLDDRVLPSGRLREPLDAARTAHALLVAGSAADAEEAGAVLGVRTVFTTEPRYGSAQWLHAGSAADPPPGPGSRVVVFSGIAAPERFVAAARMLGWDVVHTMTFSDHHWYSPADLDRIAAEVTRVDAIAALTTEKDAVRLDAWSGRGPLAVLPMDLAVEPAAEFERWLMTRLRAAETAAPLPREPRGELG